MKVIDNFLAWWRCRRFKKTAHALANGLVGDSKYPIKIRRFKKGESPKPVEIVAGEHEEVGCTIMGDTESNFGITMIDSKTPQRALRKVFNDRGQLIKEITVPLKVRN
jgi:hypothetical protein